MTFGIAFASSTYAGIVTDRLLSGDYTADSDKCGAVAYRNGRFVYTIAGLAEAGVKYLARKELASALCEAGRPTQDSTLEVPIDEILQRVAAHMSVAVGKVRVRDLEHKKTSILLAGYQKDEENRTACRLHLISNFESLQAHTSEYSAEFRVSTSHVSDSGAGVAWIGCAEMTNASRDALFESLERGDGLRSGSVTRILVAEIRRAAKIDPRRIGTKCTSLVTAPETAQFEIGFHSDAETGHVPATAFVHALYGERGAYITLDQRLTGAQHNGRAIDVYVDPPAHKRQKCPCGSGIMYKNCHGNDRASHEVDSYTLSGTTKIFAMPTDGSELQIFSNDMLKR